MSKRIALLSEAIKEGFDPRNIFPYFTAEQFISFSNWISSRHSFDWKKYEQWLHSNYNLWHDPMPPIFAPGDSVTFSATYGENARSVKARVNATHIYTGESKYDVELHLDRDNKERIYNVSSGLLSLELINPNH